MKKYSEQQIIESWHKNAKPWISAVRKGEIESRQLVTNKAIVETILQRKPKSLLDIGCGEGWLVREVAGAGIDALGIDIVPELIESARGHKTGRFQTLAYEAISAESIQRKFELVVCNFSLLGKESVEHVFAQVPSVLIAGGAYIVQTLHPVIACGDLPYQDGWRRGSWAGFSEDFSDPAPWYFRTLETWKALFSKKGLDLVDIKEPLHPTSNLPVSIIFIAEWNGKV